ncbi:hypothetical protein PIGHUM_04610 [Pigmentiphaga humi]|uniref:Uncharacterized protein n=1 Tax=Pigmentiphaga humi TaxID=2478468 RepID=A0A3P4B857_9BURK|nr:hypothetical protein [Pigmentiphaga humi]VCU72509.1 hypothetical protein PIGHUM_04610 [Pigmentiphaga humi]
MGISDLTNPRESAPGCDAMAATAIPIMSAMPRRINHGARLFLADDRGFLPGLPIPF